MNSPVPCGDPAALTGARPEISGPEISAGMCGALMVCGTTSDAGKSQFVVGLCRVLARRGVRVAPFKAQNMANNSYVTHSGHEIGRAQGIQAVAARVDAEVAMNPILLKPVGDRVSQVMVSGSSIGHLTAAEYHDRKPSLVGVGLDALADLRSRFDVVICEGAGSPTEINLLANDIVNLRVAHEAALNAIVVGDINPGGVFASLYGTVALLPEHLRLLVRGFVINKFRGDPALLLDGTSQLQTACGVPTLGVLPWIHGLDLDAEDSMSLAGPRATPGGSALADTLDVAVIQLPRIANFTDFDPLAIEPGVSVRFVAHPSALGRPDFVIIPGSKATVGDLGWLRERGFVDALNRGSFPVLGICAGYQMLGRTIDDVFESGTGVVEGLGWLPVDTQFEHPKVTRQRTARAFGEDVTGYQIHHGRVRPAGASASDWMVLDDGDVELCAERDGRWIGGTTLHGFFESDAFRRRFLVAIAERNGRTFVPAVVSYQAMREAQIDRMADALEEHIDLDSISELIATAPRSASTLTGSSR